MSATQKRISQRLASVREAGTRGLKADELITLADSLGVRAAAIANIDDPLEHARFSGPEDAVAMRAHMLAYLELDDYLTDRGVPPA